MAVHLPGGLQGTVEIDGEGEGSRLARFHVEDNRVVCLRGKAGALVSHIVDAVDGLHRAAREIQRAAVDARRASLTEEVQFHAAYGEVAHAVRTFYEILVYQFVGALFLSGEDRVAHGLQLVFRLLTIIIIR